MQVITQRWNREPSSRDSAAFFVELFLWLMGARSLSHTTMGLFDKLKESFGGDDKPKSLQVTFVEKKMGMTISAGKKDEAVVTAGQSTICTIRTIARDLRRERNS